MTVISDDGEFETGRLLVELAERFGIGLTVAGTVQNIEPRLEWWQETEKAGKIELVNHSWSHARLDEESPADLLSQEYLDAKGFFEQNFETPQFVFIPPFNYISSAGYELLEQAGILAARRWTNGFNELNPEPGREPGQWLNLRMKAIGDVDTTEARNKWLTEALERQGWLIEMWHNVYRSQPSGYQPLSFEQAKEHIEFASALSELWIAPFTEAVASFYQQRYLKLLVSGSDNEIFLELSKLDPDLPWRQFKTGCYIEVIWPGLNDSASLEQENAEIMAREGEKLVIRMDREQPCKIRFSGA